MDSSDSFTEWAGISMSTDTLDCSGAGPSDVQRSSFIAGSDAHGHLGPLRRFERIHIADEPLLKPRQVASSMNLYIAIHAYYWPATPSFQASTLPSAGFPLQFAEHPARVHEMIIEDPAGHLEQFADKGVAQRVPHR